MPAQATRGIWHAFPLCGPNSSGVRKVTLGGSYASAPHDDAPYRLNVWSVDAYAYYSTIDHKWYKANGQPQRFVTGFYELSR